MTSIESSRKNIKKKTSTLRQIQFKSNTLIDEVGGGWVGETVAKQLTACQSSEGLRASGEEGVVWTNFLDNSKIFLVYIKLS